ncbi:MAG: KpsF/GutQ family sugar-phosphate isomerase [Bacteroides sp.]
MARTDWQEAYLNNDELLALARKTVETEAQAISSLIEGIDSTFVEVVQLLLRMKGRVICTGIGKSAIIAQKIVATFNSTGTPAIFMHAADAIHGDLGIIQKEDVVLCLSKSGETAEIKVLVPLIHINGNPLIAMVSNTESFLAQHADYILRASIDHEACPNNLAPTSSTTVQLVLGDVLAVCLLKARGFSPADFARYHPGGALGKRLYLRVEDLLARDAVPKVLCTDTLQKVILEISHNLLGATAVLSNTGELEGIITDGDLRRMLQRSPTPSLTTTLALDIMTRTPKTIQADALAIDAFNLMEKYKITQLIVNKGDVYVGMIHIHDLLKEGIIG